MKKCILGILFSFGACYGAEDCSDKSNLEGFFIGAGVNHQYTMAEATVTDNLFYTFGYIGSLDANGDSLCNSKVGKFGGTISLGYGEFLSAGSLFTNNWYSGLEVSLDITENKTYDKGVAYIRSDPYGTYTMKTKGLIPTVAWRFGGYMNNLKCLAYFRLGFSRFNHSVDVEGFYENRIKNNLITPVAGIGLEKVVCNSFSVKLEGDYRFRREKEQKMSAYFPGGVVNPVYSAYVTNRVKGYAVRLMGVYHVK